MQIPRSGVPLWTDSVKASASPVRRRVSIAEPAAPTPGNTMRSARRTVSGSSLILWSTPIRDKASETLVRFPAL